MLLYRIIFRTLLAAGMCVGLSILYPILFPLYIFVGLFGVAGSVALTIYKSDDLSDIPLGDLEFFSHSEYNFLEKLENLIAYPFCKAFELLTDKNIAKQQKQFKKYLKEQKRLKKQEAKEMKLETEQEIKKDIESEIIEQNNKEEIVQKPEKLSQNINEIDNDLEM